MQRIIVAGAVFIFSVNYASAMPRTDFPKPKTLSPEHLLLAREYALYRGIALACNESHNIRMNGDYFDAKIYAMPRHECTLFRSYVEQKTYPVAKKMTGANSLTKCDEEIARVFFRYANKTAPLCIDDAHDIRACPDSKAKSPEGTNT